MRKEKAPLVAEPFHRLIQLDLSGGDSCDGAHAVGNACAASGCLCGGSVSCEYYNVDAGLRLLSSLHPLSLKERGDQSRLKLHIATVSSIHHQSHPPNE
jgi:hypothetical protein